MKTFTILWHQIFRHSKAFILFFIISSSVYACMIIPVWIQKQYIDKVESFLEGNLAFSALIITLLLLYLTRTITGGFLTPLGHSRDLYYEYIVTRNVLRSQHKMNNRILLEYYESSPVYNLIFRAKTALTSGTLRETVTNIASCITLTISLSAMIGSLLIINPKFALLSFLSVIPMMIEQIVFSRKYFRLNKEISETKRKQDQCIRHIVNKEYALETRISGAASYFIKQWETYRQDIEKKEISLHFFRLRVELLLELVKSASVISVIVIATLHLSQGILAIGSFITVIGILSVMQSIIRFFTGMISNSYA